MEFVDQLVKQESLIFFDFLQSRGIIDPNIIFEEWYDKYKTSGFEFDTPQYTKSREEMSDKLETLHKQMNRTDYHIFSKEKRPALKIIYPELTPTEITQKISELWREEKRRRI